MESEIEKLRHDLERWRYLRTFNRDRRAAKVLADLIDDIEARLRAITNGGRERDGGADCA
jgi:hypothetical protein